MSKAVIFGPWIGEFSYEISWWIPELRKIKLEQTPDYHAIAVGYTGRNALYKDFIEEYVPYPKELQENLGYPSMSFIFENGQHVFPEPVKSFFNDVVIQKRSQYEQVSLVTPNAEMINKRWQDRPVGIYRNLEPEKEMLAEVKKKLSKLPKGRDTIAVNVYSRERLGPDSPAKVWDPENWQDFIINCIERLKLNVVLFGVPKRGLYPGSLKLNQLPKLAKYKKNIVDLVAENDDSLETQTAILKLTKCSVWGATGAVVLAFLTNTPVFTHQAKEYGFRLNFEWEKALTGGHENVYNFDKYSSSEMWSSPAEEVFREFRKFYLKL